MPIDEDDEGDNCGNCRYFRTDAADMTKGQCCFNAPTAFLALMNNRPDLMGGWPPVGRTAWCGNYTVAMPRKDN